MWMTASIASPPPTSAGGSRSRVAGRSIDRVGRIGDVRRQARRRTDGAHRDRRTRDRREPESHRTERRHHCRGERSVRRAGSRRGDRCGRDGRHLCVDRLGAALADRVGLVHASADGRATVDGQRSRAVASHAAAGRDGARRGCRKPRAGDRSRSRGPGGRRTRSEPPGQRPGAVHPRPREALFQRGRSSESPAAARAEPVAARTVGRSQPSVDGDRAVRTRSRPDDGWRFRAGRHGAASSARDPGKGARSG